MADSKHVGRHRLGTPGLVHCVVHHPVAEVLAGHRRTWASALLVPAKHSFAGLRRKARAAALERIWVPSVRPAGPGAVTVRAA
ncbi:hypothetical protein [Amycolatopsis rifamycinica]|uniref:Uncharacterized protein n=1 Tax=Amycolatopsis rifamycinica TaxID=287986 RepID=A0A066U6Z8_9PSEU|nr:hypothetical protein [Amycolatopsis rifamycinica]KDN21622.1 hypothetical protein DV20_14175 [Amycolatopsis rifamycinica]